MTSKKKDSLQRVLEAAATLFTSHRFEDVSIAAIASRARCSTTTIYDVWESKEKLFISAMTTRMSQLEIPLPAPAGSCFERLMHWTVQRVRTLSSQAVCDAWHAMLQQRALMRAEMVAAVFRGRRSGDDFLNEVIGRAVEEGSLRSLAPATIETHVRAVTTHVSLLAHLLNDPSLQLSERDTVERLFAPLVTAQGQLELTNFLETLDAACALR